MKPVTNKITLDGITYIVRPLNWEALTNCKESIAAIQEHKGNFFANDEVREGMFQVVHASLRRTYPDLDASIVRNGLDMDNAPEVLRIVMGASGFTAGGGEPDEGETMASGLRI